MLYFPLTADWGSVADASQLRLRRAGVDMNTCTLKPRAWTALEDDQLRFLVRQGWTAVRIAGTLDRSIGAVYHRAARLFDGLDKERHRLFAVRSAREFAALMGVTPNRVSRWARARLLKVTRNHSRRGRRAPNRTLLITDERLSAFLANRRGWMLWDPEDITDADWRGEALKLRQAAGGAWVRAVSAVLAQHYAARTAPSWCVRGRLATVVKVAGTYWVWVPWQDEGGRMQDEGRGAGLLDLRAVALVEGCGVQAPG